MGSIRPAANASKEMSGKEDIWSSAARLKAELAAASAASASGDYLRAMSFTDQPRGVSLGAKGQTAGKVPGSYTYGLTIDARAPVSETLQSDVAAKGVVAGSYTYGLSYRAESESLGEASNAPVVETVSAEAVASEPQTVPEAREDRGLPDNLTRIKGVSDDVASALNAIGVTHFRQISEWTAKDVSAVSAALGLHTNIQCENWIEQAAVLASGAQTRFDGGGRSFDIDYGPASALPSAETVVEAPVAVPEPAQTIPIPQTAYDNVPAIEAPQPSQLAEIVVEEITQEPDYGFLKEIFATTAGPSLAPVHSDIATEPLEPLEREVVAVAALEEAADEEIDDREVQAFSVDADLDDSAFETILPPQTIAETELQADAVSGLVDEAQAEPADYPQPIAARGSMAAAQRPKRTFPAFFEFEKMPLRGKSAEPQPSEPPRPLDDPKEPRQADARDGLARRFFRAVSGDRQTG